MSTFGEPLRPTPRRALSPTGSKRNIDRDGYTSEIRLNLEKETATEETASPSVLGEAGRSPAEKKSP
jgi:hypothetical protein